MKKKLVIVESPAKANTIKKILGKNYEVAASYGHIRDLPKTKIGVDVENGFEPSYITIKGKGEITKKLKQLAKKADKVYIASDMDREGEAIAWHVNNILKLEDKMVRIEFNEITKAAIKEAVKNPREIDMNRVYSQQTRRILDRLVGYKISPLLWKIISSNTSAGRVQSVALKLICDLEDIIKAFIPEKYWEVNGNFGNDLQLNLHKINEKKTSKIKDEKIVIKLEKDIKNKKFEVVETNVSQKIKSPPPPLKTSTLQQLSASYIGYSASKTMKVAQTLYEGVKIDGDFIGLITYMRTDSLRISDEAKNSAKVYIEKNYGKEYVGDYIPPKAKGKIQDAHEAIRPSDVTRTPDSLKNDLGADQFKLYKLIWERFMISQFSDMKYQQFEVIAKFDIYKFRGIINKVTFDGYYKIFKEEDEIKTADFPEIKNGEILLLNKLNIEPGETKPPKRLTESSIVKKLESEEIGRPSTYAAIIDTLKKREYVEFDKKSFVPTELGYEVKNKLEKYFPNIMNIKFTAEMEENLDMIEEGEKEWKEVLESFYGDLKKYLDDFEEEVKKIMDRDIFSDVECPQCKGKMLLKTGRFGKFLECEKYEECKGRVTLKGIKISTEEIEAGQIYVKERIEKIEKEKKGKPTDYKSPECKLPMLMKWGRFGPYLECENYEECKERISIPAEIKKIVNFENDFIIIKELMDAYKADEARIIKAAGKCEKCGSDFLVKKGRFGPFLACSGYPECKNIKKIIKKKE